MQPILIEKSVTSLSQCNFTYQIDVENFSQLSLEQTSTSEFFHLLPIEGSLKIHVKNFIGNSVGVGLRNMYAHPLKFDCTVVLKDIDKGEFDRLHKSGFTLEPKSVKFITKDQNDSAIWWCIDDRNLGNLPSDILRIQLVLHNLRTTDNNSFKFEIPNDIPQTYECMKTQVLLDFEKMYKDSKECDVKFLIGEKTIEAHKCVLSVRSEVFERMLKYETTIKIVDLTFETLDAMMIFLYSGKIPQLGFETQCNLYYAADKYQLLQLKSACKQLLQTLLNATNASLLLVLADTHNDAELKKTVMHFMCGSFKEVIVTEEWRKRVMAEPRLTQEVLDLFAEL